MEKENHCRHFLGEIPNEDFWFLKENDSEPCVCDKLLEEQRKKIEKINLRSSSLKKAGCLISTLNSRFG